MPQVYRLQHEVNLALSDLDSAITLSGGRGQVAEQALTQRGLVRSLQEDEEGALEDFKAAARLGSSFAQQQVRRWLVSLSRLQWNLSIVRTEESVLISEVS